MGRGKTNKRKGSDGERYYAKKFRELGYDKCITSRYGHKFYDDNGIDLMNIPFNVQIKTGKHRGINYSKELKVVREKIENNLSARLDFPIMLIHRKEVGKGYKRKDEDDLVIMSFKEFEKLIKNE